MVEPFLWSGADEEAPFGSDEGHDAFYDFLDWRKRCPDADFVECVSWILGGDLDGYHVGLCLDQQIAADLADPDSAFVAGCYSVFALDATIICCAFAQLALEGRIDAAAKPYVEVAIVRQLHPRLCWSEHRGTVLRALHRVLESA